MSETKSVRVELPDGSVRDSTIEVSKSPPWNIVFHGISGEVHQHFGDDLFEALVALRRELERSGVRLLCAGARVDVFPSGMSRSMSGGRKAYVTRFGLPPGRSDLVDIFDSADAASVGTVKQQEKFHQRWISSHTANFREPYPGEVDEARRNPNGWVYRIAGKFGPNDRIPPEAIIGAWKVDAAGKIIGTFTWNDKYDPKKWPAGSR